MGWSGNFDNVENNDSLPDWVQIYPETVINALGGTSLLNELVKKQGEEAARNIIAMLAGGIMDEMDTVSNKDSSCDEKSKRIEINDGKVTFSADSDGGWLSGEHKDGWKFTAYVNTYNSPFGINEGRIHLLEIYSRFGLKVVDYDNGWIIKPTSEKSNQLFNDVFNVLNKVFKNYSLEEKISAAKEDSTAKKLSEGAKQVIRELSL